ncbi:fructosamine kinase family protein [Fibrella forsythiae]|uniref:Fructosamine kinase family protein n=1 Tax=Fibrella forsythiae TaxID=2817061 RepID=A0ABS3JJB5_9BACT|nr:fructosamine kinase family protein [Fibrella forsythiae]MBO0950097.1 fructosamine kinase family protein [Fibrella forsythiae]
MQFWGNEQAEFFEAILFQHLGEPVEVLDTQFLNGGDINTAARVFTSLGTFFVKWNQANLSGTGRQRIDEVMPDGDELFAVEAAGLALLRSANVIRVPAEIGHGRQGDQAYLILEYLESATGGLPGASAVYWTVLGHQLAELHAHTQPQFGLDHDNFIGTLAQCNTLTTSGYDFFFDHRLLPQAGQALYNGLLTKAHYDALFRLRDRLPELLPADRPALLHGDLWTGNVLITESGEPALVDPAVYYGLREAELAFTHLFGGFDAHFYDAYTELFPLEPGFIERIPIYNLYPLLVHVNLFGSGYVSGVERVLNRF